MASFITATTLRSDHLTLHSCHQSAVPRPVNCVFNSYGLKEMPIEESFCLHCTEVSWSLIERWRPHTAAVVLVLDGRCHLWRHTSLFYQTLTHGSRWLCSYPRQRIRKQPALLAVMLYLECQAVDLCMQSVSNPVATESVL